jgi:hypothetical protein
MPMQPNPEVMPKVNPPLCPHCDHKMVEIALFWWMVSGWLVSATHCPSCWKILNTQMVPMGEAPPAEGSRIQMPS